MATKKKGTKSPRANAGKNSGSAAGKRSEQQPKAAGKGASSKPAPPKTPEAVALTAAAKTFGIKGPKSKTAPTAPASQCPKSTPTVNKDNKKGGLFKFRRYKKLEGGSKKSKHPKLIVEQENDTLGFMGLTEDPKNGHHNNIPLTKNPKKKDKRKAYLRKELRRDKLENFGEILEDYNLSKTDKQAVIEFLEQRKKKK